MINHATGLNWPDGCLKYEWAAHRTLGALVTFSCLDPWQDTCIYRSCYRSIFSYIYILFFFLYISSVYTFVIQETQRRIHRYDIFSALLWPVWNHIPNVLYICLYVRVRERVPCTEPPFSSLYLTIILYLIFFVSIAVSIYRCRSDRWYTYDRRSFHIHSSVFLSLSLSLSLSLYLSITISFFLFLSLSRVRPSGACVNVWLHIRA